MLNKQHSIVLLHRCTVIGLFLLYNHFLNLSHVKLSLSNNFLIIAVLKLLLVVMCVCMHTFFIINPITH